MAEDGEEDVLDEDLDVLHITACKEKKAALEAERERREECIERLQVKLKALNSELAARNEEVMTLRQQNDALVLQGERESRAAPKGEADGDDSPTVAREHKIRRFMEEQLKEKAQKRSARNEFGIRQFDEMELMVQKPQEEQRREMTYIDTVLITWSKGPSAELTYNLTYRVDRNMTSKKLREDACFYWGISEVEYILKTVTTNSKVQDDVTIQNCFQPNEDAHLMLVHKTPTKERPSEEELKAIRPKQGVKARKQQKTNREGADVKTEAKKESTDFAKQLEVVPGFKDFMLQRDQDVRAHLESLRLHSFCLFAVLAVATVASLINIRPQNSEFICHWGVMSAMTAPRAAAWSANLLPAFEDLTSRKELWTWLQNTVPEELLKSDSRMRRSNYLPGWLEVRMQQVAPPSADVCQNRGLPEPGAKCAEEVYNSRTADTNDNLVLKDLWVNRSGTAGRSMSNPWRYVAAQDHAAYSRVLGGDGAFTAFDASGFSIQYNLQGNLTETYSAFVDDMSLFRQSGWLGNEARSLQLSFSAYNGNHDYWLGIDFMVELSAAGLIFPRASAKAYKPKFTDWDWNMLLTTDTVRLVLVLYVCTFHYFRELRYELKGQRDRAEGRCSSFTKYVSFRGAVDLTLGSVFLYVFSVRYILLGALSDDTAALARQLGITFTSEQYEADLYSSHTIAESIVLGLSLMRFLSCCRVNRHVFIIWEALSTSVRNYVSFMLIFWPVFLGFVVVSHSLWGAETKTNKTFWDSFSSTLMMLCGDTTVISLTSSSLPWTVTYLVCFYLVMILLFVNSWIAVVVHTYQKTRVAAGFSPKSYAWGEEDWVKWTLWRPVGRIWRYFRPRRREVEET